MKFNFAFFSLALMPALAWSADIQIPREVPYYDVNIIQANVVEECKNLGVDLSEHIAQGLANNGLTATKQDKPDIASGLTIDAKISNLSSTGNAWSGHHKSLTVLVKTFKDGQAQTSKIFTRTTRGGFAGGFKGSCEVMDRAAKAIGEDIGRWYKNQG